jgi:hypothetical protein
VSSSEKLRFTRTKNYKKCEYRSLRNYRNKLRDARHMCQDEDEMYGNCSPASPIIDDRDKFDESSGSVMSA